MNESDMHGKVAVFQGGCHCGAVRYEVEIAGVPMVYECNCSICQKSGYLHLIVPRSRFRLLSGEDVITSYRFNTGVARHMFCKVCGIKSFYIPRSNPEGYSVNLRCLDGKPEIAGIEPFDGRNWEQAKTLSNLTEPD